MHILLALGVTILASTQAQTPPRLASADPEPLSVNFVNSEFKDAISLIARFGKVVIELDQTVTPEIQHQKIRVKMDRVTVEEAIAALTHEANLSYEVVNETTVRIFKKG